MMFTSHDLDDLRARAAPVIRGGQLNAPGVFPLNARAAASALSGVLNLVAQQQGVPAMRTSCAILSRQGRALDASTVIIAAAASGIALVAGDENTRAALAYWACEAPCTAMAA